VESVYGVIHHRFNFPGLRQYSGIPLDRLAAANAESLLGLVERIRPGLILAGTPSLNGSVGRALCSAAEIPFVYDVRGFPEMTWAARPGGGESELYHLRRQAETGCAAAADVVITISETMKAELVGRGSTLKGGRRAARHHGSILAQGATRRWRALRPRSRLRGRLGQISLTDYRESTFCCGRCRSRVATKRSGR
jgi:hypothetical protein